MTPNSPPRAPTPPAGVARPPSVGSGVGALQVAAWAHMRALWPRWTLLPPAPFVAWLGVRVALGEVRWEHVGEALASIALAYGTAGTRRLLIGFYPVALVLPIYEALGLAKRGFGLAQAGVHICDLRAIELRWFGIGDGAERITLPDWFAVRSSMILDVLCSVPYAFFIYVVLAYGAYLFFRDGRAMRRFGWAFLLLNVAGFVTYQIYPAAPPWYHHRSGCVLDLAALPSEGPALARVDALIGYPYFASMYARSSAVFGALPSLHVGYALLIAVAGWGGHGWRNRSLLLLWYAWMGFSAVYLDHHWIIDIVLGSLYAIFAFAVVEVLASRFAACGDARLGASHA